jgi:hypothetical protein
MIIVEPVQTAVCCKRAAGTFAPVEVGTQLSVDGEYRPPVLTAPPQTII